MERRTQLPEEVELDRRDSVRFPLTLDIRYSVSKPRAPVETGAGQIIDLSSSGLRFAAKGPLKVGLKLRAAIDWPVLLEERVQLQLVATCVVVRSSETETALQIQQHDFRTRRVALKTVSPREADGPHLPGINAVDSHPVGNHGRSKQ
jgi:c-di-GMP-binding flagellar brake protein YcgR